VAVKTIDSALATTDNAITQSKVITIAEKNLVRVINTILSGTRIIDCKICISDPGPEFVDSLCRWCEFIPEIKKVQAV
jgi:hypothetical protein